MIGTLWTLFFALSVIFGLLTGRMDAVSQAASMGAAEAVELVLRIVGVMMLWSGMMELVQCSGLGKTIERLLSPVLRRIFGTVSQDRDAMALVSANVTANLLGLSNAATPIGLQAAQALQKADQKYGGEGVLILICLNTASIQLIPTTVAAIRSGLGSQTPYDIMPAVWLASAASVAVVLMAARILRRVC